MKKLSLLDLFSGTGNFSLGLERSGAFQTSAFCEVDPYCRGILQKHWPDVPIYGDVTALNKSVMDADGMKFDAICGGFPCQDVSVAGKKIGLSGERSGLWYEYARIIGEVRPRYIIVENVSDLLIRGIDEVLRTLAALGYDAVWHCIQACDVGAPHIRDRVWIVAFLPDTDDRFIECWRKQFKEKSQKEGTLHFWKHQPRPPGVADGVANRAHRLRALGNAVVPQIPEMIGLAIKDYESLKNPIDC